MTDNPTTSWPAWLQELDLAIGERAVDIELEYEMNDLDAEVDPIASARLDEVNRMRETLLRFVPQILEKSLKDAPEPYGSGDNVVASLRAAISRALAEIENGEPNKAFETLWRAWEISR